MTDPIDDPLRRKPEVLPRVLILGGTREARLLAEVVMVSGLAVPVTSLAGATENPGALPGEVRVGGFGGVHGLTTHLWQEGYVAVIDATHPFAVQISDNAAEACDAAAVPRLMLDRRPWEPALGERWLEARDEAGAAKTVSLLKLRAEHTVFLALGRQRVAAFSTLRGSRLGGPRFLLRTTDPIEPPFPGCEVVVGRGPFALEDEEALFRAQNVRVLVCRNSGGAGDTKLQAARAVKAQIVIIGRPPRPVLRSDTANAVRSSVVCGVDEAMVWLVKRIMERS